MLVVEVFDVVVVVRVVVVDVTAPGIHWLWQYVRSQSQPGEDMKLLPVIIVLLDTGTTALTTGGAGPSNTTALLPIQLVSNRDRRIGLGSNTIVECRIAALRVNSRREQREQYCSRKQ